ncbi:hypothetical protein [Halobacillus karajensis]|uniref:Uncharacterized protein n=1 Tax=Halobacillus karajensis TaxID=195088 RepID=A0A059NXS7_9BACI|nr:hypothetical protein [Halobacillus karajensis]CDQ22591.1 hypothetical protein BN983_00804 [Halobacillus karajensis]CDQ26073.1 hypothetical protein BN981_00284 [Halobacillus karajensis]
MGNEYFYSIGGGGAVELVDTYNSETVAHLVQQLIKLQQEYDRHTGHYASGKGQITEAMKSVNKALKKALEIEGGE